MSISTLPGYTNFLKADRETLAGLIKRPYPEGLGLDIKKMAKLMAISPKQLEMADSCGFFLVKKTPKGCVKLYVRPGTLMHDELMTIKGCKQELLNQVAEQDNSGLLNQIANCIGEEALIRLSKYVWGKKLSIKSSREFYVEMYGELMAIKGCKQDKSELLNEVVDRIGEEALIRLSKYVWGKKLSIKSSREFYVEGKRV